MKKTILTLCALLTAIVGWASDYSNYYENLPTPIEKAASVIINDQRVNVKETGAQGDGVMDCTFAIQRAIDELSSNGGGHVIIPAGVWKTAPLRLKAGIDLHLEKNCILQLTEERTRHINPETGKPVPAIYAEDCSNISITGEGIIDGNGEYWRAVKRANVSKLEWDRYGRMGGTVSEKGDMWYPFNIRHQENFAATKELQERYRTHLVRFNKCNKILIQGVTLANSPKFHIALMDCEDITIDGVGINSPWNTLNSNGIDIFSCQRVLLVNSNISCGDAGIVLKAAIGKEAAQHKACENILVVNNRVYQATGGFVIGTEFAAGVNSVVVHDNQFINTNTGLRFKSQAGRGGKTSKIFCYNIYMTDIKEEAILFETDYFNFGGSDIAGTAQGKEWTPEFNDITIKNVICDNCRKGVRAQGVKGSISNIKISDCTLFCVSGSSEISEECRINMNNVRFETFKK